MIIQPKKSNGCGTAETGVHHHRLVKRVGTRVLCYWAADCREWPLGSPSANQSLLHRERERETGSWKPGARSPGLIGDHLRGESLGRWNRRGVRSVVVQWAATNARPVVPLLLRLLPPPFPSASARGVAGTRSRRPPRRPRPSPLPPSPLPRRPRPSYTEPSRALSRRRPLHCISRPSSGSRRRLHPLRRAGLSRTGESKLSSPQTQLPRISATEDGTAFSSSSRTARARRLLSRSLAWVLTRCCCVCCPSLLRREDSPWRHPGAVELNERAIGGHSPSGKSAWTRSAQASPPPPSPSPTRTRDPKNAACPNVTGRGPLYKEHELLPRVYSRAEGGRAGGNSSAAACRMSPAGLLHGGVFVTQWQKYQHKSNPEIDFSATCEFTTGTLVIKQCSNNKHIYMR